MPTTTSINFWNKDSHCMISAKGNIALFFKRCIYCISGKYSIIKNVLVRLVLLDLIIIIKQDTVNFKLDDDCRILLISMLYDILFIQSFIWANPPYHHYTQMISITCFNLLFNKIKLEQIEC
jgi:hypothetical protein